METLGSIRALRDEVRTWLDENVPAAEKMPRQGLDLTPEWVEWTLDFRRKIGAKGWLAPNWPTYFGGGGYSPMATQVILDEMKQRPIPPLGLQNSWCTALRVWGTEEQKGRWLPPTLRGEITVNQILSEPQNGSDLATKSTTAIRDGDEYVINGQKGQLTAALPPDYLFMLVNSDPGGEKYENLAMLVLDVHDAGVTVNRRSTLRGGTLKTFDLDNVRVHPLDIIGEERGGWHVAQTVLDVVRGGHGVSKEDAQDIERREREYWLNER